MATLDLVPGMVTTRAEIAAAYGGSRYSGGIVPAVQSSNVFVFSDPSAGAEHGYVFDGQGDDDEFGTLYMYTGAGATGDQQLTGNNRALLMHAEQGRDVHLFVAHGRVPGTDTRYQRYIGQVIVDPIQPFEEHWSTANSTKPRRIIVFRLRPAPGAALALTDADRMASATETTVTTVPVMLQPTVPAPQAATAPGVNTTQLEQHRTEETIVQVTAGVRRIVRREGRLVTAFGEHLARLGHRAEAQEISVKGIRGMLRTDLYDATDNVLYEAKGEASRNHIRMAIGQLLDYRRHLDTPAGLRLAVLLPGDPGEDLRDLLTAVGIALGFQTADDFEGFPLLAG